MNCRVCGRALKNPIHAAAGVGPVCRRKRDAGGPAADRKVRVFFMSSPRTADRDRRTWLVRIGREPSAIVRIYPDPAGAGRTADCDCPSAKAGECCEHIRAAAVCDRRRFPQVQKVEEN
jgi:hypothetical protein